MNLTSFNQFMTSSSKRFAYLVAFLRYFLSQKNQLMDGVFFQMYLNQILFNCIMTARYMALTLFDLIFMRTER